MRLPSVKKIAKPDMDSARSEELQVKDREAAGMEERLRKLGVRRPLKFNPVMMGNWRKGDA